MTQYLACYIWLSLLSSMSSRCIRVVACVRTSLRFKDKEHPVAWIDHILLSAHGTPGPLPLLATVNGAAMNITMQAPVWACVPFFRSFGGVSRRDAASYSNSTLKLSEEPPNFSTEAAPFYIPTPFLHTLANTVFLSLMTTGVGMK